MVELQQTSEQIAINLQEVVVKRQGNPILDGVNWQVRTGEHWSIIGLNGSGKTTLLKLVVGALQPTSGRVTVLERTLGRTDVRELRKEIGWVSSALQEQLLPHENVLDTVVSGRFATIGIYDPIQNEDVDLAKELLDGLGCTSLLQRTYGTLSQGEKQRVLIARALMNRPRILILDEPTTGLDLFAREKLLESIHNFSVFPNMPTMLYVTHHIEEVLPIFEHTLLLKAGKVYAADCSEKVFNNKLLTDFFNTEVKVHWRNQRPWIEV